jgi:hypothetical protein
MPFKETIRVLTESSLEVAKQKAGMERTTGVQLEVIVMRSMRSIGLIGVLATIIVLSAIGYSTRNALAVRRDCIECAARLPLSARLAGQRRCRSCEVCRLTHLIDEAEGR